MLIPCFETNRTGEYYQPETNRYLYLFDSNTFSRGHYSLKISKALLDTI